MGSKSFTPQEFLAQLDKGEVAAPLTLTGLVKVGEKTKELQFVAGTRCGNWTSVPIDIVESVDVLGSVPCDDHAHQRVRLTFKKPKSPEAAAYAALLSAAVKQSTGRRVMRKKGGTAAGNGVATFAGGCGCSDLEIDADGTVWVLTDVVDFEDGSCICTYQHA